MEAGKKGFPFLKKGIRLCRRASAPSGSSRLGGRMGQVLRDISRAGLLQ